LYHIPYIKASRQLNWSRGAYGYFLTNYFVDNKKVVVLELGHLAF